MNPATCVDVHQAVIAQKPFWGLTSRIRDFQDILIGGALNGRLVLPKNGGGCPANSEDKPDPFMACVFEPFSRCQTESASPNSRPLEGCDGFRMEVVEDEPGTYMLPIM